MGKQRFHLLRYTGGERRDARAVRAQYLEWRTEQGIPERCDNPGCQFHNSPLTWNDKSLKLILDHRNGVNTDDRPENLRLVCPNCDSQSETRGGKNRGRVEKSSGGFSIRDKAIGRRAFTLPAEPGQYATRGEQAEFVIQPAERKRSSDTDS
jgi:hypothetical protein